MKERLKAVLRFVANPRLLLCLAIGWMITNGWSYILLWLGIYFKIEWMVAVGGGYLAFLWLPISAEKIVTVAIAIALLAKLYPDDDKTLAVLKSLHQKALDSLKSKKSRKKDEKNDEEKN